MKTLRQISDEQPVLYAQMALEANNTGKLLIVDHNDQLQLADYPEKTDEEKAAEIRKHRNMLLEATDKYMLEDFPISTEKKQAYKDYGQQLRDITLTENFPYDAEFPTMP